MQISFTIVVMSTVIQQKFRFFFASLALLLMSFIHAQDTVLKLNIDQAITPPVYEYLEEGIQFAKENGYAAIVIELDTPGGLYSTTREIGQAILTSPVPVITYVSPQGARASSAGTFILYASHVAAMAPSTHLGSATPISLGPEDQQPESAAANKVMEDTKAYMRSLAQYHNRNERFGLAAITDATSLTAQEALENNAIEIVANTIDELLDYANGLTIRMNDRFLKLQLDKPVVEDFNPSFKQKVLFAITDPNITYLLLMAGIYGLMIELFNPGSIAPGVLGAICILIAAYSLHILPINYAGLGLIILGIAFLSAEAFIPSFGIFGFAGIAALTIGSFFLFEGIRWAAPALWVMLTILLSLSFAFITLARLNIQTHRRQPVSGVEGLINMRATVVEADGDYYTIRVLGQLWQAQSNEPLSLGQEVTIQSFNGLVANVKPLGDSNV